MICVNHIYYLNIILNSNEFLQYVHDGTEIVTESIVPANDL